MIRRLARTFVENKAVGVVGKTVLGARVLVINRWFWMAYLGVLAAWIGLGILGIIGIIQGDGFLGTLVLIIAALLFGVWLLLRRIKRFIDRQTAKMYQRFERKFLQDPNFRPD